MLCSWSFGQTCSRCGTSNYAELCRIDLIVGEDTSCFSTAEIFEWNEIHLLGNLTAYRLLHQIVKHRPVSILFKEATLLRQFLFLFFVQLTVFVFRKFIGDVAAECL